MEHIKGLGRFVRRHRRTIGFVSAAAVATAGVYHVITSLQAAEVVRLTEAQKAEEEKRSREYLVRARYECRPAVLNFLPTLRNRLYALVDIAAPVRELKLLRRGQGQGVENRGALGDEDLEAGLWEDVKVTSFTRLIAAMYAFCALSLTLHLQIHILGRHSLEQASKLTPAAVSGIVEEEVVVEEEDDLPMEARHAFLSATYEYMLGRGLKLLTADVESAVRQHTVSWQCRSKIEVGKEELIAMIRRIRKEVEGGRKPSTVDVILEQASSVVSGAPAAVPTSPEDLLLRYIINPDDVQPTDEPPVARSASSSTSSEGAESETPIDPLARARINARVQGMLNETWDTVESPNFKIALKDSLNTTFEVLYRQINAKVYRIPSARLADDSDTLSSSMLGNVADDYTEGEEIRPPLASLCSALKPIVGDMLDAKDTNVYVAAIGSLNSVAGLCRATFTRQ